MKTRVPKSSVRPSRVRTRFGYDHQWWGAVAQTQAPTPLSYWGVTRLPLPCLVFVMPFLLVYEMGVTILGGNSADAIRTGADAWMRNGLTAFGLQDRWLPAVGLMSAMMAWQAFRPGSWRFRPACLVGMSLESLFFALVLVGLGRLVDVGFDRLDTNPLLQVAEPGHPSAMATLIGFLGAGVYEEALFRLMMIPALYGACRMLHSPKLLAATVAVTASSLLFSLAHHAGIPGESFTWFAFIFRWVAGVFFAWVFLVRGFGIAVGTHAAYDVLVGWVGLHL